MAGRTPAISGYLNTLSAHRIHVRHALRGMFGATQVQPQPQDVGRSAAGRAPFTAVVAVGRRLEPWIEYVPVPKMAAGVAGVWSCARPSFRGPGSADA